MKKLLKTIRNLKIVYYVVNNSSLKGENIKMANICTDYKSAITEAEKVGGYIIPCVRLK